MVVVLNMPVIDRAARTLAFPCFALPSLDAFSSPGTAATASGPSADGAGREPDRSQTAARAKVWKSSGNNTSETTSNGMPR
jgi:hypothetical protein